MLLLSFSEFSIHFAMQFSVVKRNETGTVVPDISREISAIDIFVPGEKISADLTGYMRGHGTHTASTAVTRKFINAEGQENTETSQSSGSELRASLGGRLQRVNKLLTIEAPRFRYVGHVGDCVIGRVVALGQRRWLIDTNSRLLSILLLSAVNLPGGELRRKSEEDERAMRAWLSEGDVVTAEVQSVYHDGSLALHTRSLRYGKVGSPPSEGGTLLTVPPALVRRSKTHFHTLPCGTSIVIGNNGMVWVEPAPSKKTGENNEMETDKSESTASRDAAARVRNCILSLAAAGLPLYASSIVAAVEYSNARCSSASELLVKSICKEVADSVAGKLIAGVI